MSNASFSKEFCPPRSCNLGRPQNWAIFSVFSPISKGWALSSSKLWIKDFNLLIVFFLLSVSYPAFSRMLDFTDSSVQIVGTK